MLLPVVSYNHCTFSHSIRRITGLADPFTMKRRGRILPIIFVWFFPFSYDGVDARGSRKFRRSSSQKSDSSGKGRRGSGRASKKKLGARLGEFHSIQGRSWNDSSESVDDVGVEMISPAPGAGRSWWQCTSDPLCSNDGYDFTKDCHNDDNNCPMDETCGIFCRFNLGPSVCYFDGGESCTFPEYLCYNDESQCPEGAKCVSYISSDCQR